MIGVCCVSDKPNGNTPRGRFRALYSWLTGEAASEPSAETREVRAPDGPRTQIGPYTVIRKLGEGGMGVVYAARDERLQRDIAVKVLQTVAVDGAARQRFWREARAAASVNHPNICQIYEIGEADGELFIAMELLEGEVLSERLRWGAQSVAQAVPIATGILAALEALHARGIVHRDLKPSNVFLTAHGVKLLDFGLARPALGETLADGAELTRTGTVVGTPRYMAPEQLAGDQVDARTDMFSLGAILFEMLAGRPAFGGTTLAEVIHATRYEQPPALTGSAAVAAIDRVVRRALAKRPEDRPASAAAMAAELRAVAAIEGSDTPAVAHALTRLIVLPFRVLRPDPDTDFLAFSLADAIATSLSRAGSLVVRSSAIASRFGADPDLKELAREADVDRVVLGTLLRSGDQIRATAQLVEAPGGTLLGSLTVQAPLGDLFGLQDDISRRVTDALSLPLAGAATPSAADAPRDPRAYELYLRANELGRNYTGLSAARDLYQRCLELDPGFAPAWAHLGRCHRVIGKYIDGAADSEARAEEAFRRALEINPRLTLAQKFYAQLQSDMGHADLAIVRLLGEASRHGNDAELFAGLVHACRYCGLNDEAIAAHYEARRLDPNVPTSFEQTLLMTGDVDRLLSLVAPSTVAGADDGIRVIALGLAGRRDEARARLQAMREHQRVPLFQMWIEYLMAWLDRDTGRMSERLAAFGSLKIEDDPEAIFQEAWLRCDLGEYDEGLSLLQRSVAKGYYAVDTLARRPQFDALRSHPAFQALIEEAEAGRARARDVFREAGGERLLGAVHA